MRSGRCGSLSRWALVGFLFWVGCSDKDPAASTPPADTWDGYCVDQDGDEHGFQCAQGEDCDDSDSTIFEGCKACTTPNEGCECEANAAPVDCTVSKQVVEGSLLCKTGTRYCRDGEWSACEGIKTFEAPPPSNLLTRSLIDPDAGLVTCSECRPDCYQVADPLGADASYGDSGIASSWNGGITLGSYVTDGGWGDATFDPDGSLLDDGDCVRGTAPDFDCDGIPDDFDPFPGAPPFSSEHNTIFMDLGPGDSQQESFDVRFFLNTADIYFYLDMTGSMDGERLNLISSLRNGNYMPADRATVECADRNLNGRTDDEEYLKNEGVAGNIACMIRDSRIGAGWHRDLPFPRADPTGFAFGPHDFEAFQHEQDITDNVDAVLTGLNRFATRGGINRPEGGIMGLYALATGAELYFGWNRPGNPARNDCPAGTWGYPCFRDDAVPIIIWMTDAPITNGPAPAENRFESAGNLAGQSRVQPVNWDPSSLVIETGSDGRYNRLGKTHETFASAFDLGDINNSFRTYVFDSTGMTSDITYASLTGSSSASYATAGTVCASGSAWSTTQTAPDAVFKFRVTESEPITVSTRGSRVQSAIAIVDARRIDGAGYAQSTGSVLPTAPADLGTLSGVGNISGSTSGTGYFGRDSVGCLANDTSSADKLPAAVTKFNLANDVASLRIVTDGNYALATSLFAGRPAIYTASDVTLNTMSVTDTGNVTRTGNANDKMNMYNIGDMTGVYKRFTGGDTADGDLTPQYSAAMFSAVPACSGASGSPDDAVFDFSLSASTRLRIEGTGNNDTLQAGFDHMIGLVARTMVPHTGISGNHTDSTAYTINFAEIPAEHSWSQYNGTSGGAANVYVQSEVGPYVASPTTTSCTNAAPAANNSLQGVFVLDIPTGTPSLSYDFDTAGSSVNTWLSLHQNAADTQLNAASSNPNNGNTTLSNAQSLAAMDERSVLLSASLQAHGTTTADYIQPADMGCAASTNGGNDAVYSFTVAATQTMQVSTGAATGTIFAQGTPGFDSQIAVFANSITSGNRVAGDCVNPSGNAYATSTFTASPGNTYYVVVKSFTTGSLTSTTGAYSLWLRDTSFSSSFLACNYGSQPYASAVRSAKITRTLGPGRYYVVVKTTGTAAGAYQLNVRRTPTSEPTLLTCDRNSAGTRHSLIEQTLPAGHYSLIIRGYGNSVGVYNIIFRDLGIAPAHVACNYDGNSATPSALTVNNLAAYDGSGNLIDYYLVMRGNSTSGAYTTTIEDSASITGTQCRFDNVSMSMSYTTPFSYSYTTDINNAEWTGTLPVGEYYAVLKGYNASDSVNSGEDNDWGQWQFTIGDQASFEGTGTFDAKRWLGPADDGVGGVREALRNRKVRVIMVDSTSGSGDVDYYSDQQMRTIAQATDAVGLDGTPLFFKIAEDGTGLGTTIVEAVNTLAGNLAMDVGVRFVEAPDSPAPMHFVFRAEAIDTPGDLCQTPIDTDGDPAQLPDTHVKCTPGAVPRFRISITNPNPPFNVPSNPNDPQGGYNMRIDLIGDGQYVVDQIPVYVIPEDVVAQAGELRYAPVGTYEDTVPANGCTGTEAPIWQTLQWTGTVPSGTSLTWNVCTADTEALLDSCTPQLAASVQTGAGCLTDSNCPNGFCNDSSVCEYRVGPTCSVSDDCGVGGQCISNRCMWTGDVDVKPALARSLQGKRYARVQVLMRANAALTQAPTVNSWQLNYTCTAQE